MSCSCRLYLKIPMMALDGSSGKYTITFPKGQTPPVDAFWSITMYGAKKRLMVENSLNRYKIGSADKLKAAADGSTTMCKN